MPQRDRISEIMNEIKNKKDELYWEYEKLRKKYGFSFSKWRVIFSKQAKDYQKEYKTPLKRYAIPKSVRHFLSMPFTYGMLIPGIFLDISLCIYQQIAFRLYQIPLVKRSEYILFDRKHLSYLNLIQKVNCLYCSYMNWLFSYAVEIWGRTEKYWCPIKSARRKKWWHEWEEYFADYGDPEGFKKLFNSNKEFFKNKTKNK